MGNDPRNISDASRAVLTNKEAIAVSQDPLGQMGLRLQNSSSAQLQTWFRALANGDIVVALYNKLGPPEPPQQCTAWDETVGGYFDSLPRGSGGVNCFDSLSTNEAQAACCAAGVLCAGFSIDDSGHGCYKPNADAGYDFNAGFSGFFKNPPPPSPSANITLRFSDVGMFSPRVSVFDIWASESLGVFSTTFTATDVPLHGSAFLKLSASAAYEDEKSNGVATK